MTRQLGQTDIRIEPLILGTNTAGWTADEATSFACFDAFVDQGFTAFDTADVYSRWVPGNESESEKILGRWMAKRGNRDRVHIFTKVGMDLGGEGQKGLSARWIETAVEDSLRRLQTDYIDLYQSHQPDTSVPQQETLEAYDRLIQAGKVRWIGCSNYDEPMLAEALCLSQDGLPRYQSVQNEFNLYTRDKYEGAVQDIVVGNGLSLIPWYSLAAGFLTGKYRTADDVRGERGKRVADTYMNDRGFAILAAMDKVAESTGAALPEIALAWVSAQPGVVGPLASATSTAQVHALARGARLHLSGSDLAILDA